MRNRHAPHQHPWDQGHGHGWRFLSWLCDDSVGWSKQCVGIHPYLFNLPLFLNLSTGAFMAVGPSKIIFEYSDDHLTESGPNPEPQTPRWCYNFRHSPSQNENVYSELFGCVYFLHMPPIRMFILHLHFHACASYGGAATTGRRSQNYTLSRRTI
jgi:hypothetical protein